MLSTSHRCVHISRCRCPPPSCQRPVHCRVARLRGQFGAIGIIWVVIWERYAYDAPKRTASDVGMTDDEFGKAHADDAPKTVTVVGSTSSSPSSSALQFDAAGYTPSSAAAPSLASMTPLSALCCAAVAPTAALRDQLLAMQGILVKPQCLAVFIAHFCNNIAVRAVCQGRVVVVVVWRVLRARSRVSG